MFDLNASSLFASLFWGCLGGGILMFGKKQRSGIPMSGGIVMIALSYFVASAFYMSLAGVAILGAMYWLKRQEFGD